MAFGTIFKTQDGREGVLDTLEKGDEVEVIEMSQEKNYLCKVKYFDPLSKEEKTGWIIKYSLSEVPQLKATDKEKQEFLIIEKNVKRRKKFINDNPDIPEKYKKAIDDGKVLLGMSADMVRASWGESEKINRSVGNWGVHEQWIYGSKYLYFENGILTSWQE